MTILIREVTDKDLTNQARQLFIEYGKSLNIDLSFQDFKQELKWLPRPYCLPRGCLLLAYFDNKLAGCVALRKLKNEICEMKRLYVRPEFRRKRVGSELSKSLITRAIEYGYRYIRLDTLPFMKEAINLYRALGFKEIAPYCYNPVENAKFFELEL